jgi:predicted transposase YbfD/YdcC
MTFFRTVGSGKTTYRRRRKVTIEYTTPGWDVNAAADGVLFDVGSLYEYLYQVRDSRHARGVRYALVTVLVYVVLAKLAGENTLTGVAEWVQLRQEPLSRALHLEAVRAPHRTTYSRLLSHSIDRQDFTACVQRFFTAQPGAGQSIQLCLDGKTLRGTIPAGQSRGVHLLAAFLPGEGWVLAQVDVDGKENEITAAPRLLETLDLRGKVVTGDALLAQKSLSTQIVEAGGDYVWTVKDNQPELVAALSTLFEPEQCTAGFAPATTDFRTVETVEKGHGRLERRTLTASQELTGYLAWPYARQVFKVERHRQRLVDGKVEHEVVYGVTSLSAVRADAAQLLRYNRGHWGIENGLHYRRDQTLREDWCQVRTGHAAQLLADVDNLVVGLLLTHQGNNMPHARRIYAASWEQALSLILRC